MRTRLLISALTLLLGSHACTDGNPGGTSPDLISRETFIEAYIELRVAALQSPGEELALADRDRILGEMGLEEEDLLNFVEVRGRDVQFMRRVWEEVDSVITSRRQAPDAPGQRGTQ